MQIPKQTTQPHRPSLTSPLPPLTDVEFWDFWKVGRCRAKATLSLMEAVDNWRGRLKICGRRLPKAAHWVRVDGDGRTTPSTDFGWACSRTCLCCLATSPQQRRAAGTCTTSLAGTRRFGALLASARARLGMLGEKPEALRQPERRPSSDLVRPQTSGFGLAIARSS